MNNESMTDECVSILKKSESEAERLCSSYIGSEHLLLAILSFRDTLACTVLNACGIDYSSVNSLVEQFERKDSIISPSPSDMSARYREIIEKASGLAKSMAHRRIGSEHLLYSMTELPSCIGTRIISGQGGDLYHIRHELFRADRELISQNEKKKLGEYLIRYGTDLTEKAAKGEIDELIGREEEIQRAVRILSRRMKNNPCLVGHPGVGKSAIAEGLALKIVRNEFPAALSGKILIQLDLTRIIGGAKYRGDFEERLKKIVDEAENDPRIILFIDEIHMLTGSGSCEGGIDGANILKPALARGKIRLIGATTYGEYKKYIERDEALERRFGKIDVREPTREESYEILRGIKKKYEKFHSVSVDDEVIRYAVESADRYIPSRFMPDKAIDLLDEAMSGASIDRKQSLTFEDVNKALSLMIGYDPNDSQALIKAGERIKLRVGCHFREIDGMISVVGEKRNGFSRTPVGILFTAGDKGEKEASELADAFTDELFGKSRKAVIDLSEYSESHSLSRLLGSPPGYVGYTDEGVLSKTVSSGKKAILFTSAGKAAPQVIDLLVSVLEYGRINDNRGKTLDFSDCVFMICFVGMTKKGSIGFSPDDGAKDTAFDVPEALKRKADAEFNFG